MEIVTLALKFNMRTCVFCICEQSSDNTSELDLLFSDLPQLPQLITICDCDSEEEINVVDESVCDQTNVDINFNPATE